ncbi:MAG: Hsp20/alpha crystallin family protein [Opitutales bacterium]|nr:Hsp20/alpha crystallin family protein [Opitutales bacterium]
MRLIKYENLYENALNEFERFFDRALSDFGRFSPLGSGATPGRSFRVDIYEDADTYYVTAELPGIDKGSVKVELENAVLTISGEHRPAAGEKDAPSWSFSRSITVSDDINAEKVGARMENGLLTVSLPKPEVRKPRRITVG